jgi:hypothetical protein
MKGIFKIATAVTFGLLVGGGAAQVLHAQSKPPAFVVAEIAVRDQKGYEENFLKPTLKDIADHGGKFLAGGYDKTLSILGTPRPTALSSLSWRIWTRSRNGKMRPWIWRTLSVANTRRFASMPLRAHLTKRAATGAGRCDRKHRSID